MARSTRRSQLIITKGGGGVRSLEETVGSSGAQFGHPVLKLPVRIHPHVAGRQLDRLCQEGPRAWSPTSHLTQAMLPRHGSARVPAWFFFPTPFTYSSSQAPLIMGLPLLTFSLFSSSAPVRIPLLLLRSPRSAYVVFSFRSHSQCIFRSFTHQAH